MHFLYLNLIIISVDFIFGHEHNSVLAQPTTVHKQTDSAETLLPDFVFEHSKCHYIWSLLLLTQTGVSYDNLGLIRSVLLNFKPPCQINLLIEIVVVGELRIAQKNVVASLIWYLSAD